MAYLPTFFCLHSHQDAFRQRETIRAQKTLKLTKTLQNVIKEVTYGEDK